jgi:hypothetical protein
MVNPRIIIPMAIKTKRKKRKEDEDTSKRLN